MFHVAYLGHEQQVISSLGSIALHYLKGSFLLDLIACFPFDYIMIFMDPDIVPFGENAFYNGKHSLIAFSRLNRMLQCYRLFLSGTRLQRIIYKSLTFLT